MKKIGGFFELELQKGTSNPHRKAYALSTGRSCLSLILALEKPSKVYVPYYSCDALVEPMISMEVDYEYYPIDDQLELKSGINLKDGELIVVCDFFGIKSDYVEELKIRYGNRVVVDATHAFFKKYDSNYYSFTSARKYFGVPDGAYLYAPEPFDEYYRTKRNSNIDISHNVLRMMGQQEEAFRKYKSYEKSLNSKLFKISIVSEYLLSNVDFKFVKNRRKENFLFFHKYLKKYNELQINDNLESPFCYPLIPNKEIDLKEFYSKGIYIPKLWIDTCYRNEHVKFHWECLLSKKLLPLPIDHRYNKSDLTRVLNLLIQYLNA